MSPMRLTTLLAASILTAITGILDVLTWSTGTPGIPNMILWMITGATGVAWLAHISTTCTERAERTIKTANDRTIAAIEKLATDIDEYGTAQATSGRLAALRELSQAATPPRQHNPRRHIAPVE